MIKEIGISICLQTDPSHYTGFSPFQLINEFNVHGPIEALCDNWVDGDIPECNLVKWVDLLWLISQLLHVIGLP